MEIGRKIYYDKATGNVILDTGEKMGDVVKTTREQDFASFKVLNERVGDTVGLIELEFGQYNVEFRESWGQYRINTETEELEFSYTNPTLPEPTVPVYEKSLLVKLADVSERTTANEAALLALLDLGL